jgi:predicted Fe-Mo cluster-binding NifX family protein
MKVAVPVKDTNLSFFGNAGHTPYFAVYTIKGGGMFKSFDLEDVRPNPRNDLDHEHEDEGHQCSHSHEDEAHVQEHFKMGEVLKDCDFLVTKSACKNTAKAMENYGVSIKKYKGSSDKSDAVLRDISSELV